MSDEKKARQQKIGRVVSIKMDKTATVLVKRRVKHALYGKVITRSTKFHVHDADNQCAVGDTVSIISCRPRSKTKSWELADILERGVREVGT